MLFLRTSVLRFIGSVMQFVLNKTITSASVLLKGNFTAGPQPQQQQLRQLTIARISLCVYLFESSSILYFATKPVYIVCKEQIYPVVETRALSRCLITTIYIKKHKRKQNVWQT